MFRYLSLLALILSAPSLASTVVYTDRHHLPANVQSDTRVVYLDETEQLTESLFDPLSKNSVQAERQAQSIIHSPEWKQRQAVMVRAYQGLIQAWQLGLKKYPAVVFDDRDVVYGTADVALARTYLPGGTP
ncbi:TIGR03757 family integrating conjugative element protein [Salmonella enterica subsp. enterica]|uniref:TIGR03757 family integrating conjugative element protein n=1 Tax=Salmonella enterica TaxID=28901 RepID=A0A403F7Y7_SALER|nr:TIGR03757 family integrating conjugative element protein [Salmonella enterica]EBH8100913.1 TIGR03757 family integrating conjugative element protein [Salmonella enterica subsp. houtenae serovar O:11:g,z25:-]ECH8281673.1 TIGR03757 family integrating conjugative element protein [Salmonella enterica subsp. enterica]EEJ1557779.1 TIGR03757 family integrating conjugative element protein [Salmonella enterica subsp. houtenae]EAY4740135.1 TIGR03757 family integrating conjugative element protein [Salmo